MGRIAKTDNHSQFEILKIQSNVLDETRDCTVKATALALNISYKNALDLLADKGRKNKCGLKEDELNSILKENGLELRLVLKEEMIDQYPHPHYELKNITTHHMRRFTKVWRNGTKYIAYTRSHVLYIDNGEVIDWSINNKLYITSLYEIIEGD